MVREIETEIINKITRRRIPSISDNVYFSKKPNSYECYIFVPNTFAYDDFTLEAIAHYVKSELFRNSIVYVYYDEQIRVPADIKKPVLLSLYFVLKARLDEDVPAGGGDPYTSPEDYRKGFYKEVSVSSIQNHYIKEIKACF